MVEKVLTNSEEEKDRLLKDGYVVTATAYFEENQAPTYTLEKGSEWGEKFKCK